MKRNTNIQALQKEAINKTQNVGYKMNIFISPISVKKLKRIS